MLTVAMIGIGDIAQKAWLPALFEVDGITPVLIVRDRHKHKQLSAKWRASSYESLEQACAEHNIDLVSIHAATWAHFELAAAALALSLPVVVDKPVATKFAQVQSLYQRDAQIITAFNRRLAPLYQRLGSINNKTVVSLSKHRHNLPGMPDVFIFDDFIHVLDTIFWWAGVPTSLVVSGCKNESGELLDLSVTWLEQGVRVTGEMSRQSGETYERAVVIGQNEHGEVNNLRHAKIAKQGQAKQTSFGD